MSELEQWPHSLIQLAVERDAFLYAGPRKMVQDITWTVPEERWPEIDYSDLGYGRNKFPQLKRNYLNESELERMRTLLDKRAGQSFSSLAMSLRGQEKDSRSMGHCMQTLVLSWTKKGFNAEVQYRSTEIIQKFGADIVFTKWLLEQLDFEPEVVRFRFANAYLSAVYFPLLCYHWDEDPVVFFEYLWDNDRYLFNAATRPFLKSAHYGPEQKFPYSPENIQHKYAWEYLDMPFIGRYLRKKHKEEGIKLPSIPVYE